MMKADHPLANRNCIAASEFEGLTVLVKESTCIYREVWERTVCQTGQNAFPAIEVGSFYVIQQMVKAELGVGIVPIYSGLEVEDSLVIRSFADMNPIIDIGIVIINERHKGHP